MERTIVRAILMTSIQYTDLCEEIHTIQAGNLIIIESDGVALIGEDYVEIKKDQYAVVN